MREEGQAIAHLSECVLHLMAYFVAEESVEHTRGEAEDATVAAVVREAVYVATEGWVVGPEMYSYYTQISAPGVGEVEGALVEPGDCPEAVEEQHQILGEEIFQGKGDAVPCSMTVLGAADVGEG